MKFGAPFEHTNLFARDLRRCASFLFESGRYPSFWNSLRNPIRDPRLPRPGTIPAARFLAISVNFGRFWAGNPGLLVKRGRDLAEKNAYQSWPGRLSPLQSLGPKHAKKHDDFSNPDKMPTMSHFDFQSTILNLKGLGL
jgi:hypothetical protein